MSIIWQNAFAKEAQARAAAQSFISATPAGAEKEKMENHLREAEANLDGLAEIQALARNGLESTRE